MTAANISILVTEFALIASVFLPLWTWYLPNRELYLPFAHCNVWWSHGSKLSSFCNAQDPRTSHNPSLSGLHIRLLCAICGALSKPYLDVHT